jgi:hypothetical protein
MKTIAKVLAGAALVIALAGCSDIALRGIIAQQVATSSGPQTIRVGSIADVRFASGWTLDGSAMTSTRAKLLNPANFGPNGTVKKTIIITDTAATITATLLSGFDVFFIGYMPNLPGFLAGEITAMQNWVSAGGVMIVTADDPSHNQVAAAFGYGMATSVSPGLTSPVGVGLTHPVFAGPFGNATGISGAFSEGKFTGNVTGQLLLGYDAPTNNIYTVIEIPYGSGRVLMLADVDFLDAAMTAGATISLIYPNEVFLGNVFAYEHK